jgi:hypothetical protein
VESMGVDGERTRKNGKVIAEVRGRQQWRPAGLRSADAILARLLPSSRLDHGILKRRAWQKPLEVRVGPWQSPVTMEWPRRSLPGPSARAANRSPNDVASEQDQVASPKPHVVRGALPLSSESSAGIDLNPANPVLLRSASFRPALRLAILRPPDYRGDEHFTSATSGTEISQAPLVSVGNGSEFRYSDSNLGPRPPSSGPRVSVAEARRSWSDATRSDAGLEPPRSGPVPPEQLSSTDESVMTRGTAESLLPLLGGYELWRPPSIVRPQMIGSRGAMDLRSVARRVIRGGFPLGQGFTELGQSGVENPSYASVDGSPTRGWAGLEARAGENGGAISVSSAPAGAGQASLSLGNTGEEGAIARLIAETVSPAPLPGLQLRLIPPPARSDGPGDHRLNNTGYSMVRDEAARAQSRVLNTEYQQTGAETRTDADGPGSPILPTSRSREINVNEVADKVLQTLARRQRLERERKGTY